MNRRHLLELGAAGRAAILGRRLAGTQSAQGPAPQPDPATTPIKTMQLHQNLYLLQGAGGNMVLQVGADGNILIDFSFAPAVPRIREIIAWPWASGHKSSVSEILEYSRSGSRHGSANEGR
jgi:hypothetical protein